MSWSFYIQDGGGSSGQLPTPPSRDTIIHGRSIFQGLRAHTEQYGDFNAFGPELNMLDRPEDRQDWYAMQKAGGTTICQIGWAGSTYSSGGFTFPVPGPEMRWVDDLPGFCDRLAEILIVGQFDGILLMLPGDGITGPDNRYGNVFLQTHIQALIEAMRGYRLGDLTKYTVFCPGYDGVVWVWPEQEVFDWGWQLRGWMPDGYQALIYPAGIIGPSGEGKEQYVKPHGLQCYDIFLQQFPIRYEDNPDQVWQIGDRMLGPAFIRPPDMPPSVDPDAPFGPHSPKFLLSEGTPRGEFCSWGWEFGTYLWSRGAESEAWVQDYREKIKRVGWTSLG